MAALNAGHISSLKTTQLFTVQEAMQAMGNAGKIVYAASKG